MSIQLITETAREDRGVVIDAGALRWLQVRLALTFLVPEPPGPGLADHHRD